MSQPDLEHLFDLNLIYKEDQPPVSLDGKVGEYVGSGEGRASGQKLNGHVRWSLFEAPEGLVCPSNLFGVITTEDGAEIRFDSMGFFRRPNDAASVWQVAAVVRFETQAPHYAWLRPLLGVWQGRFDMASYLHDYQVYAPPV